MTGCIIFSSGAGWGLVPPLVFKTSAASEGAGWVRFPHGPASLASGPRRPLRKSCDLPRIALEAKGLLTEKGNPPCGERKATGREASRVACLEIGAP